MSQIVKAFFCLISVWIIAAATLPLTQDEAYYTLWGEALRWGYFDHPPFVAFLTSFRVFFDSNSLWYQSPLSSRIGAVVAASLHFWIVFCLYRLWGIRDKKLLLVSLLLVSTNFLGLLFGVITTPDTGLILFWSLSLLAASRALAGQRMFWLLTGFFVGCGLLSKYTMVLMGLVLLVPLLGQLRGGGRGVQPSFAVEKPALLTPWPYAGGLVAFLVFLPHVMWNAENQWITMRFQLRHGFSLERPGLEKQEAGLGSRPGQELPRAQGVGPLDREYLLSAPYLKIQEEARVQTTAAKILEVLNIYAGFLGSQVALWGFWLGVFAPLLWRLRRQKVAAISSRFADSGRNDLHALMVASWGVPLFFFLALSPITKVEANWSAMYVIGAAAHGVLWSSQRMGGSRRKQEIFSPRMVVLTAGLQSLVLLLLAFHGRFSFLPLKNDRILKETAGYPSLGLAISDLVARDPLLGGVSAQGGSDLSQADWAQRFYDPVLAVPFFVESYQLASMLQYTFPRWRLRQWPGVTRDSEFSYNPRFFAWDILDITRSGGFWLLVHQMPLPKIPPYAPDQIIVLKDCKTATLQVMRDPKAFFSEKSLAKGSEAPCRNPLRTLYLTRYRV